MGAEERDIEAMWEHSSASRRRRPDATRRKLCPRGPRVRQDTGFVTELRGPSPDPAHVYSFYCIMVSFKEIYLYHFGFPLHLLKTKRMKGIVKESCGRWRHCIFSPSKTTA